MAPGLSGALRPKAMRCPDDDPRTAMPASFAQQRPENSMTEWMTANDLQKWNANA
jgi:hypothetical protein